MKREKRSETLFCPAKINLFLEVGDKRADGYHNIDSIMQAVSLCDRVTLTLTEGSGRITLTCDHPSLPADSRNIAYRAAERYLAEAGIRDVDVAIELEKKIPLEAGLAGGSTDCAGVLRAMQNLLGGMSEEELFELAAKLGADVPFCLACGCHRAEGIGEKLTSLPSLSRDCILVIVKGGEGVSTKEAYAKIDEAAGERQSIAPIMRALARPDYAEVAALMFNRFEQVILPLRPAVAFAKETMIAEGAAGAMMSGSGPSVFGIFFSWDDAERAYSRLLDAGYESFLVNPVL